MPKKIVLIAEDYADVRELMKFVVKRQGYTVLEAADGQEAVKLAEQHCPDLILMDLSMPVMDGLTATKTIRTFDGCVNTPIIALTAFDQNYHQLALQAGCNKVIIKPVDFNVIETLLKRHLDD